MSHATTPAHPAAADPPAARSPLRWLPGWLRPGWSRLPGHQPRPAGRGRPVKLRDGSKVLIRQVRPADAALVADGFTRLSPRSRQMRFLTRKKGLSDAELRYFTDVDHHDHEALAALNHADGRGVASPATSGTPTTRTRPKSPSPSSTTGKAADWAPS